MADYQHMLPLKAISNVLCQNYIPSRAASRICVYASLDHPVPKYIRMMTHSIAHYSKCVPVQILSCLKHLNALVIIFEMQRPHKLQ